MMPVLLAMLALPMAPLTLPEAVDYALQHQPLLEQAEAQVDAAGGRVGVARSALMPQVSLNGSITPRTGTGAAGTYADAEPSTSTRQAAGVEVNQLLWDFGKSPATWRAARLDLAAQQTRAQATRNQLLLDVHAAFFTAQASLELVDSARQTLENERRHVEQVSSFVRLGVRPEIDLVQSRLNLANAELALIRAQNESRAARAALNQVMGRESSSDFEIQPAHPAAGPDENASVEDLLPRVLAQRPDIQALMKLEAAQQSRVAAQRAGWLPTASLSAGVTESGTLPSAPGWEASAGIGLSWTLFNGGRQAGLVQQELADLRIARSETQRLRQTLRLELEQALLEITSARAAVQVAEQSVSLSRERLRLAEGRYQTGVGSLLEVEDAQAAVSTAAGARVQTQRSLDQARARLRYALGWPDVPPS